MTTVFLETILNQELTLKPAKLRHNIESAYASLPSSLNAHKMKAYQLLIF